MILNSNLEQTNSNLDAIKSYSFSLGAGESITLNAEIASTFLLILFANNVVVRYEGLMSFSSYSGARITQLFGGSQVSVETVDTYNVIIKNNSTSTRVNVKVIRLAGIVDITKV
ncbi:MAG: hypothetical protein J6A59_17160 [Lachnospiraceae bacterium]|nr:hypothetical protein [Lachnospiraceae bacterium]